MSKFPRFEALKGVLSLRVRLMILASSLVVAYVLSLRSAIAFDLGEWARNTINNAYSNATSPQPIQNPVEQWQRDRCTEEREANERSEEINRRAAALAQSPLTRRERFLLKDLKYPQQIRHVKRAVGEPDLIREDGFLIYGKVMLTVTGNEITGAYQQR